MQDETPQLEDGYTRLANELFDAILAFPFSGRQLKVLMTIVRKTYGYNKKRDDMSASQIASMCGVARPHVVKTLGELVEMNVIQKESGKFGSVVEINKKYRTWASTDSVSPSTKTVLAASSTELVSPSTELVLVPNQYQVVPKRYTASTESVQVASTKSVHTKDNLPKDNQQKELSGVPDAASEIIGYLNRETGCNFQTVPANVKFVLARAKEGATLEQMKRVIDAKVREWLHDPKMRGYLRPATLFNATNYAQYVGALGSEPVGEETIFG